MDISSNPRPVSRWTGAALGALWTGALVALSALLHAWMAVPNAAFVYFEAVSRWLPGALVTTGIEAMLKVVHLLHPASTAAAAKVAEQVLAISLTVVTGAVLGLILAVVARRVRRPRPELLGLALGAVVAGLVWLVPDSITRASTAGLVVLDLALVAWGGLVGASVAAAAQQPRAARTTDRAPQGSGRRQALAVLTASAIGVIALASGSLSLWNRRVRRRGARRATEPSGSQAGDPRTTPVPGTRAEITSNDDFYRVDIDLAPPRIDADRWRLQLGGLVARPRSLTIAELRGRAAVTEVITLECISNPVGGDLISTAPWTGVRLGELLREAGIDARARAVAFRSVDGFHESTDLARATADSTLLVYAMNGAPLPADHGFPLRLYMPDRHGMKLPKWIERIDVVEHPPPGYWVERGWSRTAIPHTTSIIDVARIDPRSRAAGAHGRRGGLRRRSRHPPGRAPDRWRRLASGAAAGPAAGAKRLGPVALRRHDRPRPPHPAGPRDRRHRRGPDRRGAPAPPRRRHRPAPGHDPHVTGCDRRVDKGNARRCGVERSDTCPPAISGTSRGPDLAARRGLCAPCLEPCPACSSPSRPAAAAVPRPALIRTAARGEMAAARAPVTAAGPARCDAAPRSSRMPSAPATRRWRWPATGPGKTPRP